MREPFENRAIKKRTFTTKSDGLAEAVSLTILFILAYTLLTLSFSSAVNASQTHNSEDNSIEDPLISISTLSTDDTLTIYNPDGGLIMQYPSDWNLVDDGSYEISLKPSDLSEDGFAFFKITIDFLDFLSLDEYANGQRSDLVSLGAMAEEVGQLETDTVDGNSGYFVLYSDEYFSGFQEYVVHGSMGYTFDYSADHDLYDSYLPIVEQMIYGVQLFEPPEETSGPTTSTPPVDLPTICRWTPGGQFQVCYNQ